MKTDLRQFTFGTAVLVSIYAIFRIVRKCCWWGGIHIWSHHPIRAYLIGSGIDNLFYLCVALFLLVVWKNRNQLPSLSRRWDYLRYVLVFSLLYMLLFQIQLLDSYPMHVSSIFIHTLWIVPVVYVIALWGYYNCLKTEDAKFYSLNKARSVLLLSAAVVLLIGVGLDIILSILWYHDAGIRLDRWHTRIPMLFTAISEIQFVFFLILKNK